MANTDGNVKSKTAPSTTQLNQLRETLEAVLAIAAPDHKDRLKQLRDDLVEALRLAEESEAVANMLSNSIEMHGEIPTPQLTAGAASLARAARQLTRDLGNLIDRIESDFKIDRDAE